MDADNESKNSLVQRVAKRFNFLNYLAIAILGIAVLALFHF